MKRNKAVVIGCGQIGALYDLDNDLILTHAKGYFLSNLTDLQYVVDIDENLASRVAKKYYCKYKMDYKDIDYKNISIVSICVPTEFHFEVLSYFYHINYSNIILLEKPVVETEEQIKLIENFPKSFLDNIFINYIRSYDTTYRNIFKKLKMDIYATIEYIEVEYFGEFEHNAVHALNLINTLFDTRPNIKYGNNKIVILDYCGVDVYFRSLSTQYINYNITIYTRTHKICFNELGYNVSIYKSNLSTKFDNMYELELTYSKKILNKYMLDLLDIIFNKKIDKPTIYDGIKDLNLIKDIKNVSNYTS